jgi:type IV secretory pathway VirJ component
MPSPEAGVGRTARGWRIALLAAGLALVVGLGLLAHLGYFGGEVFRLYPARGVPATAERGIGVVFLSSDLGLNLGMGGELADRIAGDGLPVVGVNSLTYFRHERTPREAAALIEDAMRRALARPGVDRLVLIGQSFGADMLQASFPALPASYRDKVLLAVLVVPPDTTLYRASPAEIFDFGQRGVPAAAHARRLTGVPLLCVQGSEESDSLCPALTMANVTRVALPGGHMLNFDPERLYAAIAPQLRRAAQHYQ